MRNPIVDILAGYNSVPISAVSARLPAEGGLVEVRIVRLGGTNSRPSHEYAPAGVSLRVWEHLPDIIRLIEGEYYSHEVRAWCQVAARDGDALDVLEVADEGETRWHWRPCNPRHWLVRGGCRSCLPGRRSS